MLSVASSARGEDAWWSKDKAAHASLSFALSGASYAALWILGDDPPFLKLAFSASLAIGAGLAKEIYDSGQPKNSFSTKDLTWDIAGAVLGGLAILGVELLTQRLRSRSAPPPSVLPHGAGLVGRF